MTTGHSDGDDINDDIITNVEKASIANKKKALG
jgi:hypothetical protein